jgi:hypothetical protein
MPKGRNTASEPFTSRELSGLRRHQNLSFFLRRNIAHPDAESLSDGFFLSDLTPSQEIICSLCIIHICQIEAELAANGSKPTDLVTEQNWRRMDRNRQTW